MRLKYEREKAPVLEMNDIERVRKQVKEEEKLGEDEDSQAEEGLADAVGVLNEFDQLKRYRIRKMYQKSF